MAYPTAGALSEEILDTVQDSSFEFPKVLALLNQGLKEIAGASLTDGRHILLPDLAAQSDLATDTTLSYIDLPATYQRNLHYCYSVTNCQKVRIFGSLRLLHRQFGELDLNGRVIGVAVRGNQLHYQRIPSTAETLRIHFYALPTALVDEDSEPDCLPEHLAWPLLVNFACREIFKKIEDALEGPKTNTTHYDGLYQTALNDLANFIGTEGVEPVEIEDEIHWEAFM